MSIADQEAIERTLPLAVKRGMGVIAKRPIANAAWRYARRPSEPYYQPYWERLRALEYPFLRDAERAVSTALRFTLAAPGVHTAIVGTKRPERWPENARLLEAGPLPAREVEADPRPLARGRSALLDRRGLRPAARLFSRTWYFLIAA